MLEIPGLGPKKARKIWQELEISTVGELEYACQENRLIDLDGFGEKTQNKILEGIQFIKQYQERHLISDVMEPAIPLLDFIKNHDRVIRAELAGSLRRHYETVKDIDIVASTLDDGRAEVMDDFVGRPNVADVTGKGETKSSVRLENGINVDLRLVSDEQFPYALHHFTGSKEHNTAMRALAKSRGMKMNEYGLFQGDDLVKCQTEHDIFDALDLDYIPPELRENTGEIEYAASDTFPDLIQLDDLQGIIHVHSHYSDAVPGIRELAEECRRRSLAYIGITDHSQSAFYANGLQPDRLKQQWEEIKQVQEEFPDVKIFRGIESDILPDGSLDYEDEILAQFDFVIASIHSNMGMDESKQTARLIAAVQNQYTTILGHPTARLLLARDEIAVNMPAVIEAAGEAGTAIEINANPRRLDLDWRLGRLAQKHGVKTSINPDAHHLDGFDHVQYGVGIARKGWFTKQDVINTWDVDQVNAFFQSKRN